jgi:hypothetical protein
VWVEFKPHIQVPLVGEALAVVMVHTARIILLMVRLVELTAAGQLLAEVMEVAVVREAVVPFVLFGPAFQDHSLQQEQVTCDGTLYSYIRWETI